MQAQHKAKAHNERQAGIQHNYTIADDVCVPLESGLNFFPHDEYQSVVSSRAISVSC